MATGQVAEQFFEMDVYGECGSDLDWGRQHRRGVEWERNNRDEPLGDMFELFVVLIIVILASDYVGSTKSTQKLVNSTPILPDVGEYEGEEGIRVESPGVILTLEEACKKLREQAETFSFQGKDSTTQGRVDVVRVASNEPVEDEWYAGQGKGPGGNRAVYAAVYDGHA